MGVAFTFVVVFVSRQATRGSKEKPRMASILDVIEWNIDIGKSKKRRPHKHLLTLAKKPREKTLPFALFIILIGQV